MGGRHQAEDLTADVFREALAGIHKFEWRGVPFAAWLLGISARILADFWRRSGREIHYPPTEPDTTIPVEIERSAAISIAPPAGQPFGGRIAVVQDPFGNTWRPAEHIVPAQPVKEGRP